MFDVTIKTLDGRDSLFTVDDEEIPVSQQRLIFQGRALQDGTRLMDCGVKDKVVHLVPRPPPSAQRENSSTSTDAPETNGPSIGLGGLQWGGVDMQQAIQDITSGIFSGLGDFGRTAHFHGAPSDTDHLNIIRNNVAARLSAFDRLHRRATHLQRCIARQCTSSTSPRAGDSSASNPTSPVGESNDDSNVEEGSNQVPSTQQIAEESSTNKKAPTNPHTSDSPMSVDPEPSSSDPGTSEHSSSRETTPSATTTTTTASTGQQGASTTGTQPEQQRPRRQPISVLADMLSRQRRLWQSAEPYFERWEAMVQAESRVQQHLDSQSSPTGGQQTTVAADENITVAAEPSQSSDTKCQDSTTPDAEQSGSTQPSTISEWKPRLFTQVSRLLHLHGHMMHAISDFSVTCTYSPGEAGVPTTAQPNATSTGASRDLPTVNLPTPAAAGPTVPPVSVGRTESSTTVTPARRCLFVPIESTLEPQWIGARINVDPLDRATGVAGGVGAGGGGTFVGGVPASPMGLFRSRVGVPTTPMDRRRSQSASNPNRVNAETGEQSATTMTTTTVGPQVPITTGVPRVVGAPTMSTTSIRPAGLFGSAGTTIIHRVDIPIVSMNMISMPTPYGPTFMPAATTTQAAPTSTATGTPVSTGPARPNTTGTPSTATQPSTTTQSQPTPLTAQSMRLPIPLSQHHYQHHHSHNHAFDPFLPCHSRHLAHESHRLPQSAHHRLVMPVGGGVGGVDGTGRFVLPFQMPHAFMQSHDMPAQMAAQMGRNARTTAANSGEMGAPTVEVDVDMVVTNTPTSGGTTTTTTANGQPQMNAAGLPSGFAFPANMQQQIASMLSAATNAATSAVTSMSGGGLDAGPFNVYVTSNPAGGFHVGAPRGQDNRTPVTSVGGAGTTTTSAPGTGTRPAAAATAPGVGQMPWLFGRDNPLMSTLSFTSNLLNAHHSASTNQRTATTGPPRTPSSTTPVIPTPIATPAWVNSTDERGSPLTGINRFYQVLTTALIHTVWSRLLAAARHQGVPASDIGVSTDSSTWNSDPASPHRPHRVATGLLTDVLSTMRTAVTLDTNQPSGPAQVATSSLDTVRLPLHQLVGHATTVVADQARLTDELVDAVMSGLISDEMTTGPSGGDSMEARVVNWAIGRAGADNTAVVDVRASIARLLRTSLTAQLSLWRTSPTDSGFGWALLITWTDFCVDCFCLIDLLTNQMINQCALDSHSGSVENARRTVFGPFLDTFGLLTESLMVFTSLFPAGSNESWLCQIIAMAITEPLASYMDGNMETLVRRRNHLQNTCLVHRTRPVAHVMDVDSIIQPLNSDIPSTAAHLPNDTDMDDYVDASSEWLPETKEVEHSATQPVESIPSASPLPSSLPRHIPDWNEAQSNGSVDPWTNGLNAHPNAAPRPSHPNEGPERNVEPASWHAVLPPDWVGVVAGDVSTMRGQVTGQSRTMPPQDQTDEDDASDLLGRFSDAYLAGMPAKRRKVMQEHARSLAQPPGSFLADCLTDAVRLSGYPAAATASSDTTEPRVNGTADVRENGHTAVTEPPTTNIETDLVASLRDLVADRIANRLSTDPDFDPNQFPLSREAFLKQQAEEVKS